MILTEAQLSEIEAGMEWSPLRAKLTSGYRKMREALVKADHALNCRSNMHSSPTVIMGCCNCFKAVLNEK